jgi:hypothetical protein
VAELPPRPDIPEVPDNINAWKRGFSRFSLPKGYPRGAELLRRRNPRPLRPSIYMLYAHGCDLGVEYPVPDNCMYVTKTICGEMNAANIKDKQFFKDFQENDPIFKNPIDNIDEIEERYIINTEKCSIKHNTNIKNTIGKLKGSMRCETIHVKHSKAVSEEMRHYNNAIFTPYIEWHFAGLYEVGSELFEKKMMRVMGPKSKQGTKEWNCKVCTTINTCANIKCITCESAAPNEFSNPEICMEPSIAPIGEGPQYALAGIIREKLPESQYKNKIVSYLSSLYRNSTFPTSADVKEALIYESESFPRVLRWTEGEELQPLTRTLYKDFTDIIAKHFRVDLETLFKYFPGIYYSFACRLPCGADHDLSKIPNGEASYPGLVLRRERSLRGRLKENLAPRTLESARRRALSQSSRRRNISARRRALMKGGRTRKVKTH